MTTPGVLAAQALVTQAAPALRTALIVSVVVALVACAVPARTPARTAALAATAQLAGHAILQVTTPAQHASSGCLSVVGRGADLGVRYALAHDSACPPGTVPTGPTIAAVLAAVAAAVVVLLGHAVLATLTGVLIEAATSGLGVVRRLAAAVLPSLAGLVGVRVVPVTLPAPPLPEPPVLSNRWQPASAVVRGPPARLSAPA